MPVQSTAIASEVQAVPDGYLEFLRAKMCLAKRVGIEISDDEINPILKPHQRDIVRWAMAGGQRAIFASFGLGKTMMQLEICRLILKHKGGAGLIVCPLGVRGEFMRDAKKLGIEIRFVKSDAELSDAMADDGTSHSQLFITNYESVREGKLNPTGFIVVSLDEAAICRGFGRTKTFRELMKHFEGTSTYRFVATATPDPNEYIELLAYAAFLGIMDVGQGKTLFFKRDSTKADKLTLHVHRAQEFWLWVSSWAIFLNRPSDLGYSDEGYDLPPLKMTWHEIPSQHTDILPTRDGQGRMFMDPVLGLSEAAKEKRNSMDARILKAIELAKEYLARCKKNKKLPKQIIVWCELNDEQDALSKAFADNEITVTSLRGSDDIDAREVMMDEWRNKDTCTLLTKLAMYGSGANLQQACKMIFSGIAFKFADFIQGLHRVLRFLQMNPVEVDAIYTEAEVSVRKILEGKWDAHTAQLEIMSAIIREHGLASISTEETMRRTIGCDREQAQGERFTAVKNDTIIECADRERMPDGSVNLIITSIPFSFQYEYSPSYNDLGHTESNSHFWQQMDFLAPNLLRVLAPGRVMCVHVKDRIVPGGVNGFGFQTLHPFHSEAIAHYCKHGFAFLGMKTIVTDVVRENNQTYRLGWSEQCKDGSRMGCGVPEYVLLFRKPPTDRSNGYADVPVEKDKPMCDDHGEPAPFDSDANWRKPIPGTGYSRGRWQLDAHGFARSGGNRLLTTEELHTLPHAKIFQKWREESLNMVHDHERHVNNFEVMDRDERLPATFMVMPPASWHPDVWTDIARMRTLNMEQERKGQVMHLCPLQYDIVDRLVVQFSNEGELVFDPFGGLMSVPYRAIKLGRRGMGVELNAGYWKDGVRYCKMAEANVSVPSLFDLVNDEDGSLIDG